MIKKYSFLDLEVLNRPFMPELRAAIDRVALSGRYIGGSEVESFEQELAAMTGTECAVGTSNGLDALRMIFRALIELGRLKHGDEVLVQANTYIASFLAVSDTGLKPVPVDIDPLTSNIDAGAALAAMTARTRAILPVHLYGRVCWNEDLHRLAIEHNLIVVEDNAQAIGAYSRTPGLNGGRSTGALGHAAAFSFYPTKNIGALGDAGAVTTDDAELAAAIRALANYGSDRRYHNIYQGFNCRLDPMQAAVLRVKLPHTAEVNASRQAVADVYSACISNPVITLPTQSRGGDCVWHQYVVLTAERDRFREYLAAHGVPTDVNYPVPPHRQPCYSAEMAAVSAPVAEQQARTLVCLPVGSVSPADAKEISTIINDYRP